MFQCNESCRPACIAPRHQAAGLRLKPSNLKHLPIPGAAVGPAYLGGEVTLPNFEKAGRALNLALCSDNSWTSRASKGFVLRARFVDFLLGCLCVPKAFLGWQVVSFGWSLHGHLLLPVLIRTDFDLWMPGGWDPLGRCIQPRHRGGLRKSKLDTSGP